MKIEAAFRPLAELERKLADLYGSWAEALEDDREAALERVRGLCETGAAPSLERAVEIALEFEALAAESHFRAALKQVNPEMERLLNFLGGEDQQHVGRLTEFAAKRGMSVRPTAQR
jgi:hypothetical protein